jgi:hypothetical protein
MLEVWEGGEGGCEVVPTLFDGIGLDVHEDGEAVDCGCNGLRCLGRGTVECCNKAFDGSNIVSRCGVDAIEEVSERARILVGGWVWRGGVSVREPVCEGRHVLGCDG